MAHATQARAWHMAHDTQDTYADNIDIDKLYGRVPLELPSRHVFFLDSILNLFYF